MANAVVTVLEADGVTQTDVTVLDVGRQAAATSKSVAASTEDKAVLDAMAASLSVLDDWDSTDKCKVTITDGTSTAAIKAASTAPVATDQALVVTISPNGQAGFGTFADGSSIPVAWSTEAKAQIGSLTETAPASDTASSGLNGRLQRIAQRITSLIALVPTALGANGGFKIEGVASGTAVPISAASLPSHPVGQDTATIYAGATGLTPKRQKITASASGATEIVALVSSKKIRVLAWDLSPNAAVNAKWQSHTAGDITGLYYMGGQGNGQARGFNPVGWFETTAGEALDINLSGAVAVGGVLTYVEV